MSLYKSLYKNFMAEVMQKSPVKHATHGIHCPEFGNIRN